jgi:hypothetical protein
MPNRKELISLVDHAAPRPAFPDGHPFIDAVSVSYWSSSTSAFYISPSVWVLNFIPGWVFVGSPNFPARTIAVRTPAPEPGLVPMLMLGVAGLSVAARSRGRLRRE